MAKRKKSRTLIGTKKKISEPENKIPKKEISHENKILRNFFIGIAVVAAVIALFALVSYSISNFEYKGVKFRIVKEGNLVLYNTKIPVIVEGKNAEYNFYFRNDPRIIGKEIPFDLNGSNFSLAENLVLNSTSDFNCNGDGIIAVANLVNLYKISGINVIKDGNAVCDEEGRYAFVNLQEANETRIEKFGPECYNVSISNCEILEATERLMLESFIKINKLLKEN